MLSNLLLVYLNLNFSELSSNDVSIVHALALLRSIGSDAKQAREVKAWNILLELHGVHIGQHKWQFGLDRVEQTGILQQHASPNHGSTPANDDL
jgi:hypothetical protein